MHNNIHKHAFLADFVHETRINSQQNQEGLKLTTTFESLAQKQGHEATLLDCVFLDKSGLLQYLGVYYATKKALKKSSVISSLHQNPCQC